MRLSVVSVAALFLVASVSSATANAGGAANDDSIVATADASSDSTSPVAAVEPEVVCDWGSNQTYYRTDRSASGEYVYMYLDQNYWRVQPATGEVWVQTWRICRQDGQVVSSSLDWRRVVAPDPRVIAEGLYDEVVRQVPVPEPALSPAGPGFVNLGMWLAVEELPPISVTANAGAVWATTSAELVTTTFDMGDGSVVTCEGAGDPVPSWGLESLDPSPACGHTYTDVNGREPFVVTVTSTWRVVWVGSGGTGGDLGELRRSTSLAYSVLEIQTVGS